MNLIVLLIILAFLAFCWWLANMKYPVANATIKFLINFVIIATAIVLVLIAFGVWQEVKSIQVPKI